MWKFRHDALLSTSLAFHMGLSSSKRCCMCNRDSIGVNHYIACEKTKPMWKYVEQLYNRSGFTWKSSHKFKGVNTAGWFCLNHLIRAAYLLTIDCVLCKLNRLPHDDDLPGDFRRKLFEILYFQLYTAKLYGNHKINAFHANLLPLNFLYKIDCNSIDIRHRSFQTS